MLPQIKKYFSDHIFLTIENIIYGKKNPLQLKIFFCEFLLSYLL
jgi:hypothetical protein